MKNEMKTGDARHSSTLTFFFLTLTGLLLWSSFSLSRTAGLIPQAVLTMTFVLLVVQFLLEWRKQGRDAKASQNSSVIPAIAWMSILPAACWLLGMPIGAALFSLAWLRWHAGERWLFSMAFALMLGLTVQWVFGFLLQARLYPGLLLQLIT